MATPHGVPNIDPASWHIPPGYIIGRISLGSGRPELIPLAEVARQMIALGVVPAPGAAMSPASITGTGLVSKTGTSTFATRTLAAPAAGFTISNADGVSGNPTFALADDLAALEAMGGTGLVARTAANTYAQRTLTPPAAGISVSNGDGVSGNPTLALANDLAAVEGISGTGLATRTASDTWTSRTITGTANRLSVTNGDGVSGNPTLDISTSYVGQATIVTLGTITTGTWNAGVIAGQYGGTGVANTGKTITLGGDLSTSGAFGTTITVTATTNSTLPAGTHTLAGLDVAQAWTANQDFSTATFTTTSASALTFGSKFTFGGVSGGAEPTLNIATSNGYAQSRASNNGNGPQQEFGKSRGSVGTPGAVQSGDRLWFFRAFADDGSTTGDLPVEAATYRVNVTGTVSAGIVSANHIWHTMNAAGVLAQRAQIGGEGGFSVGTTTDGGSGVIMASAAVSSPELRQTGSNGQVATFKQLTELLAIAAAATSDTTIQIPANAIAYAVSVRVTTTIPTATTFDVGIAGATTRYGTGLSTASTTTNPGTNDAMRYYAAATAIRITPNLTPATNAGRVRVTIHYIEVTPPTS